MKGIKIFFSLLASSLVISNTQGMKNLPDAETSKETIWNTKLFLPGLIPVDLEDEENRTKGRYFTEMEKCDNTEKVNKRTMAFLKILEGTIYKDMIKQLDPKKYNNVYEITYRNSAELAYKLKILINGVSGEQINNNKIIKKIFKSIGYEGTVSDIMAENIVDFVDTIKNISLDNFKKAFFSVIEEGNAKIKGKKGNHTVIEHATRTIQEKGFGYEINKAMGYRPISLQINELQNRRYRKKIYEIQSAGNLDLLGIHCVVGWNNQFYGGQQIENTYIFLYLNFSYRYGPIFKLTKV